MSEEAVAAATYPERMEYRMLGEGDGTEDGEAWYLVQAWYWPGESLPREVNEFTVMGNSPEGLRRELRALLAATEKPSLTRGHMGRIMEGAE